ncbi:hypothetical protein OKJ48_39395 [Streptomyces kunmingensis]|uniref:Uncharacterized protein n=1 Tax=Streptomyces kunmingensis TaxID=68225 RepID=A0ABU6CNF3_9ACTN|nr:hypothetical protein [Streptomyces kunmingensis]MEB3966249.1 hypothetical protein [Streptomyces kunmingensis]
MTDMPARLRRGDHEWASFPADEHIPAPAIQAVTDFINLRVRGEEAEEQRSLATRKLSEATAKDRAALDEHVLNGGSASTFTYENTAAAKKAIVDAEADADALKRVIGPAYLKAAAALQDVIPQGKEQAAQLIEQGRQAYTAAIGALAETRRAYLEGVGLMYFWECLHSRGECVGNAGYGDQINMARGPITRVDAEIFKVLHSDAQAHTRLPGQQQNTTTL